MSLDSENTQNTINAIVDFWLNDVGIKKWYAGNDPELDETIRQRFMPFWQQAKNNALRDWLSTPKGALAYLILSDQMPRNMYRGHANAFATDPYALAAAQSSVRIGHDMQIQEPERQFFYLPFMHSESLSDQDLCIEYIAKRMPKFGAITILHARVHREIILLFNRFPYRNAALGRVSTPEEQKFINENGYSVLVDKLEKLEKQNTPILGTTP